MTSDSISSFARVRVKEKIYVWQQTLVSSFPICRRQESKNFSLDKRHVDVCPFETMTSGRKYWGIGVGWGGGSGWGGGGKRRAGEGWRGFARTDLSASAVHVSLCLFMRIYF